MTEPRKRPGDLLGALSASTETARRNATSVISRLNGQLANTELELKRSREQYERLVDDLNSGAFAWLIATQHSRTKSERQFSWQSVSKLLKIWWGAAKDTPLTELIAAGDKANAQRDWEKAAGCYAAALRLDPLVVAIWVQLGHALKEQGALGFAELAYRRAVSVDPMSIDALVQLGHFLNKVGHYSEAILFFQRAGSLDPSLRNLEQEVPAYQASPTVGHALVHSLVGEIFASPLRDRKTESIAWPPASIQSYWLTQGMRDYLTGQHGDCADLYQYLMSVVEAYRGSHDLFVASADRMILINRARDLAQDVKDLGRVSRRIQPEISIVIPVYNNIVYTLTCIVSILECAGEVPFEIIIGDDCSTDSTPEIIQMIGGVVRLVRSMENRGFLLNCNDAARHCRGKYIVMLNNDTLILPGWLDSLIQPMKVDDTIGITGSKLLNGDGTLQEAGGIFWRDGSAWNFGRNQDPGLPEFNYLKDVDYVSGAALAMPKHLWDFLEGFDRAFVPAYCEDADLSFRVRKHGRRVVYVPTSEVIHHEGASHGRDEKSGIKAYQVVNMQKFHDRWREVLEAEHFDNAVNVVAARDRSRFKPHILVVDHYVPEWDRDAGSRSMLLHIKMFLDAGFQVSLWPDNLNETAPYTRTLQKMGVEVVYSSKFKGLFTEWYRARADFVDYVFLSRPHIAEEYLPGVVNYGHAKILYYGHDLHFLRMQKAQAVDAKSVSTAEIEKMRMLELSVCAQCDVVFFPNDEELGCLRPHLPGDISLELISVFMFSKEQLLRAARRLEGIATSLPKNLLFVGGFNHTPNGDGIHWFVAEVMPALRALVPGVHLDIVGSNVSEDVLRLACEDISVHGYVADDELARMYENSGLAIAPLRYGGGMKGKVLEAMARGVPVATTSVGTQGISEPASVAFVGDTASDLARAIGLAFSDVREAVARASKAIEFIQEHHSFESERRRFAGHIPEMAAEYSRKRRRMQGQPLPIEAD
jgi:GT2 family glycosyltransferase/tetratricopeptide (TPR) repeat protein